MKLFFFYFFIFVVEEFIFHQYCTTLFMSKQSKKIEWISFSFVYGCLLLFFYLKIPWTNILLFAVGNFLLILFLYQVSVLVALFHAAISTLFMGICELIIVSFMPYLMDSFASMEATFQITVIAGSLSKLLYLLLMYLLTHFFRNDKTDTKHFDKTFFFFIMVPVFSAYQLLALVALCQVQNAPTSFDWLISLSALSLQKEADTVAYYKMLIQQNENQHFLIHDIKKHLQSISLLNENGEQKKIEEYFQDLFASSSLRTSAHLCNNEFLNAILYRYISQCREKNITLHADIRNATVDFLKENALTSLFCNLLDNAMEAAAGIPDAYIEISAMPHKNADYILITMTNSCRKNPFVGHSRLLLSTKKDKQLHGFGTRIIQRIAKEYDGETEFYYKDEEQEFHSIILLKKKYLSPS